MSVELVERCRAIATSTWSDALDQLGVVGVIHGLSVRSGTGRVAGRAVTRDELDQMCNAWIARFKRPKHYYLTDELPKNSYGKIVKTELRILLGESSPRLMLMD